MPQDLFAMFSAAMDEAAPAVQGRTREPAPKNVASGVDLFEVLGHKPAPRTERTWGEVVSDTALQLTEGANNLSGTLPNLLAPDSDTAQMFQKNGEYLRGKLSEPMKRRMADAEQAIGAADQDSIWEQGKAAAGVYGSDPVLAGRLVLTNLPSMIPGVAAAKGAQGLQLARGATAAAAAASGTAAAGATNAVMNAGGARGEAYEDIYKTLKDAGYSDEDANRMALRDSLLPAAVGAVAGAASGGTGLERVIVRKGAAKGGARAAAKAMGAELGGELLEEVTPQVATNMQAGQYDGRPLSRDVGRTAVETAFASGPGTVLSGAGAGFNKEKTAAATPAQPGAQDPGQQTGSTPAPAAGQPGEAGAQATTQASTQEEAKPAAPAPAAAAQTQERSAAHPDGDPLQMEGAAAAQRMAELELMDSTTGLNADQQRERMLLAHRLDELAEQESQYHLPGEEPAQPGQAEQGAQPGGWDPADLPDAGVDVDAQGQQAAPAADQVRAKTWPQFVVERGHSLEALRRGTNDWNALQTEWAAVKNHRAGLDLQGSGSTGAPVAEIQNRDRSRPASVMQMQTMAQNPDYMRLGPSRTPESGAPMVFAEGDQVHAVHALGAGDVAVMSDGQRVPFQYAVMEAADVQPSNFADGNVNPLFDAKHPGVVKALNNGRTAGLRAAYERGTAGRYKHELLQDSGVHGVDPQVIDGMKAPVLVRLYSEKDNRHNMGVKSQSQALGLSAAEQAATDAQLMDPAMLDMFDAGALDGQGNQDFVRGFVARLQGAGQDVAEMMDAAGRISPKGVQRLAAALVHKAFDDGDLVETMFGSQDNDVRAIGEALKDVAGQWAHMRHMATSGAINPEVDLNANLLQAIRLVQKARRDRSALSDLVNQVDMETGDVVGDMTVGMLRLLYSGEHFTRARGRDAVTQGLREYVTAALATSANGSDMFGEEVGPTQIVSALTGMPVNTDNASKHATNQQTDSTAGQAGAVESQKNEQQIAARADEQAAAGQGQPAGGQPAGGRADERGAAHPGQPAADAGPKPDEDGGRRQGQDAQDQGRQQGGQGNQGDAENGRGAVSKPAGRPELRDTRGTGVRLHGTSRPLPESGPSNDEVYGGNVLNIYGQGFYTTDAADIAAGYTRKGRGGAPTLYDIKEKKQVRLYDMDGTMDPEVRAIAERALGDLARDEDAENGEPITTLAQLFDEARAESAGEGISASEVQERFFAIRENLEEHGYRGFTHTGGKKTGNEAHKVNIYWYPEDDLTVAKVDLSRFEKGAEAPALASYTAGEIRDQAKAAEEAQAAKDKADKQAQAQEKAEREAKEVAQRMDASADNFQLGQDANDALAGQGSIFDAAPAVTESGKSATKNGKTATVSPESATETGQSAAAKPSTAELDAMFDELMAEEFGQAEQAADAGRPKPGDIVPFGAGRAQAEVKGVRADGTVTVAVDGMAARSMPMAQFQNQRKAAEEAKAKPQATGRKPTRPEIQYRDDSTGQTWTGRGKRPKWLEGKNLEDFSVKANERGAGQALASAAKNAGEGLAAAIDGLGALFGGAGKLGSGLSFDEQTYAKAKPLFAQAVASMQDAGSDLREAMRAIIKMVGAKFGAAAVRGMQPYVVRYISDLSATNEAQTQARNEQKEGQHAPGADGSVERHSGQPAAVPADAGAVQGNAADTAGADAKAPGQPGRARGPGQLDDARVSVDAAALAGKRSDQQLHRGGPPAGLEGSTTGADHFEGMPAVGSDGISIEPVAAGEIEALAAKGSPAHQPRSNEARKQLSKRTTTAYQLGGEEHAQDVRDAIPQLLPGQVDDVVKAEQAFAKPDGHGMVLTNGTGTGKTFSGLGVGRRFADQGKLNILVVVPDDKIAGDWIDSGKAVGLQLQQLANTKSAGTGPTVVTYANLGENNTLASRQWDLVIPDEAHTLMSSQDATDTKALERLRAITYHPRGVWARLEMLHAEDYARQADLLKQLEEARKVPNNTPTIERLEKQRDAVMGKLQAAREAMQEEFATAQADGKRTKLLALSATPFAYEKNIDWAEGYLFSYDEGRTDDQREVRSYNEGANREQFFMQHFGYRMRYNKLTAPEAGVDRNLMQRQFNTWLKRRGVLSTRMLEVDADYDRRFVLFESAIGNRIDEALTYLAEHRRDNAGFEVLAKLVDASLDYQTRRYLLEAIKASEAVKIVRQHMALGRKVIVYHDFIKGGGTNPFNISPSNAEPEHRDAVAVALADFNAKFGDLQRANLHQLPSPVQLFSHEFPGLRLVNGQVKPKRSVLQAYKDFDDDATGPQVMLVQSAKDKGWSGHDTTGKHQRVLINLGLPTAPTKAIQQEGRIYRTGNVSDAIMRYLNTGTSWERTAFASTIATRAATAENLALGELARSLQDSFIQAFEDSAAWEPGHEGEGKGGKEQDRARNAVVSEWDRARTLYWAQQKKTAATKAREGADYFATAEPLGLKMVEWGGVVEGEDTLEPSAGHGAIARWLPSTGRRTMVEPSPVLRSRLALAGFNDTDRIVAGVFEDLDIGNKFDVVVMNPPFGTAGRTAVDHMAKAYRHLRERGRLVALLPAGPAADKKLEAWLYEKADKANKDGDFPYTKPELHRVADILLPGLAFGRAGTDVATRVVVIDKLAKDDQPKAAHRTIDLSNAQDIGELFERLENQEVPKRLKQLDKAAEQASNNASSQQDVPRIQRAGAQLGSAPVAAAAAPAAQQEGAMLPRAGRKLVEHFTAKGKRLEGVVFEGDKAQAEVFDPYTFKKDGGWFIRAKHLAPDVDDAPPAFYRGQRDPAEAVAFVRRMNEAELREAVSRARKVAGTMLAKWSNALPVQIVGTMQDEAVPERVRYWDAVQRQGGATGEPAGFIYKGVVYLVASQLPTNQEVAIALGHEMLGHAGLRGTFGDGLKPILVQISKTRTADMERIAADYGMSLANEQQRLHVAEEILAFMAQEQPNLGFVKRTLAVISTWLRENVPALANMRMTDAEMIHRFILPARAFIEGKASTQARNDTGNDDPAFLRVTPGQVAQQGRKTLGQLQQRFKDLTGYGSMDAVIYAWQDRFIDLKRIQKRIKDLQGTVNETNDAYRGEELYHKRVASRVANYLRDELQPLLKGLNAAGVEMEAFENFLHARHAPEANRVMAERNPNQQTIDAERAKADQELQKLRLQLQRATARGMATVSIKQAMAKAMMAKARWDDAEAFHGTEDERLSLSGMSDQEAANIINGYPQAKRAELEALANQVDAMNAGTLNVLDSYGLMERQALDAWRNTYKHYVPLHRDEAHPDSKAHPIGQGFSTKGDASKRRTGSNEKVTNILAHVAMQREAALTRGEKNNVAKRLYVLAAQNPDPELWSLDLPKKKEIDESTGLVRTVTDRAATLKDNVLAVRIAGHDKYVLFNPKNDTAVRLAIAMRNLDATELDRFTRTMGGLTRWFAAVNTQYNPVFSVFNLARDVQGSMLQLSTTPLAGQEKQVLKGVATNVRAIYKELRNQRAGKGVGTGQWEQLWEQMQLDGGSTGFRDLYANPKDRAQGLQDALDAIGRGVGVRKAWGAVKGWLSDFNESLEGTTRLAVYKIAIDQGLSRQEAASIAKNITVNFNRRGRNTSVVGSYYAFMNAAIQGNVRMFETLVGRRGVQIMVGGVLLGMASAMAGHLVMGGDGADDEWERVPEFVKERSIVIPLGPKDYVSIPMPLGYHVFPNIGRKLVEMGLNNDPHKSRMSRVGELALIAVNAYNPLGGSENLLQMVTPTPFDPVAALVENKDWTGKSIYKEQRSSLDPKPGHAMAKDSTSQPARWAARVINAATGGNEWRPGSWSPNPDAIEYLFGQFTGGVGRELAKVGNVLRSAATGDELAAHQIPLFGRMYGNTRGINGQSESFYSNVQRINVAMAEAKGRVERGEDAQLVLLDVPLAPLDTAAAMVEKRVRDLTKMRAQLQKSDDPERMAKVKEVNAEIEATMYRLNNAVAEKLRRN